MIRYDYWNYCDRCREPIDGDMYDTTCNCIAEIEEWSNEELDEAWDDLPRHIRDNFTPPDGKT